MKLKEPAHNAHLIRTGACQFYFTHRHCTSLVLYNEECLIDTMSLSDKDYSVVHVDTTYDMCFIHVTSISFLNTKLLGKKTTPLFGGSMVQHNYCDKISFSTFLNHFKLELGNLEVNLNKLFDYCVFSTDKDKSCTGVSFRENIKFPGVRRIKKNFTH